MEPQLDVKYVERSGDFRDLHPDWCRKLAPLAELEVKMSAVNESLVAAGHTEMVVDELIGGRLYTGPMYEKVRAHILITFASYQRRDSLAPHAFCRQLPHVPSVVQWGTPFPQWWPDAPLACRNSLPAAQVREDAWPGCVD